MSKKQTEKPDEHRLVDIEDDLSGKNLEAEQEAMRSRVERTRRRLQMNTSLPLSDREDSSGSDKPHKGRG
jgi:hypothetical protein